jgi:hypothetical protein
MSTGSIARTVAADSGFRVASRSVQAEVLAIPASNTAIEISRRWIAIGYT